MKFFATVGDVVEDPIFQKKLDEEVTLTVKAWRHREPLPRGQRYLRDWRDTLADEGVFRTEFFLAHIGLIWIKKSDLPVSLRKGILGVCDAAYNKMQAFYTEQEKNKIEPRGPVDQQPEQA